MNETDERQQSMKTYVVGLRWPIEAHYIELKVQAESPERAGKKALALPNLGKLPGWEWGRCDGGAQINFIDEHCPEDDEDEEHEDDEWVEINCNHECEKVEEATESLVFTRVKKSS